MNLVESHTWGIEGLSYDELLALQSAAHVAAQDGNLPGVERAFLKRVADMKASDHD